MKAIIRVVLLPFPVAYAVAMIVERLADPYVRVREPGEEIGGIILFLLVLLCQAILGVACVRIVDTIGVRVIGSVVAGALLGTAIALVLSFVVYSSAVDASWARVFLTILPWIAAPVTAAFSLIPMTRKLVSRNA